MLMTNKDENSQSLDVICETDHTDCLPCAQSYSRCYTSVETFDTVRIEDIGESVEDCFLGWSSWICGFDSGLHLGKCQFTSVT